MNLLPYTQHNLPKSPLVVFQGNHKTPVSPVYVTQHQLDLKQSYQALLSQLTTPDPQQAGPTEMAMLTHLHHLIKRAAWSRPIKEVVVRPLAWLDSLGRYIDPQTGKPEIQRQLMFRRFLSPVRDVNQGSAVSVSTWIKRVVKKEKCKPEIAEAALTTLIQRGWVAVNTVKGLENQQEQYLRFTPLGKSLFENGQRAQNGTPPRVPEARVLELLLGPASVIRQLEKTVQASPVIKKPETPAPVLSRLASQEASEPNKKGLNGPHLQGKTWANAVQWLNEPLEIPTQEFEAGFLPPTRLELLKWCRSGWAKRLKLSKKEGQPWNKLVLLYRKRLRYRRQIAPYYPAFLQEVSALMAEGFLKQVTTSPKGKPLTPKQYRYVLTPMGEAVIT